jgi:hypothetical protein
LLQLGSVSLGCEASAHSAGPHETQGELT